MKVKDLYAQLGHDLQAHGDLDVLVEIKDSMGNILKCTHMADRYVRIEDTQHYVIRMIPGVIVP